MNAAYRLHFNIIVKYHDEYITEIVLMRKNLVLIAKLNVISLWPVKGSRFSNFYLCRV